MAEDRFAAIDDRLVGRAVQAGLDVRDDRLGLLLARIVGGDNRVVGELPDGARHPRALRAVPIAAAAEDDDQPPGPEVAKRVQDVG